MEITRINGIKIRSNKPSVDTYDVSNLISKQSAGFICESFIHPPVDVIVEFPFPIDLSFVVLATQVQSRKCSGVKLFSKRVKSNFDDQDETEDLVYPLGNWANIQENSVFLKNFHYQHSVEFPLPSEREIKDGTFQGSLRNANKSAMKCVSAVIIRITKVTPSGPPVLKTLEVWGQPSSVLPFPQRKKILAEYKASQQKELAANSHHEIKYLSTLEEEKPELKETNENVPDEFFDSLTCEVMTLPLLLPSGNSIDSSSLDKFIASEAMWNRPASDPFTGIPFRQDFKPEPNVALKARIDRYMLVERGPVSSMSSRGHTLSSASGSTECFSRKRKASSGYGDNESLGGTDAVTSSLLEGASASMDGLRCFNKVHSQSLSEFVSERSKDVGESCSQSQNGCVRNGLMSYSIDKGEDTSLKDDVLKSNQCLSTVVQAKGKSNQCLSTVVQAKGKTNPCLSNVSQAKGRKIGPTTHSLVKSLGVAMSVTSKVQPKYPSVPSLVNKPSKVNLGHSSSFSLDFSSLICACGASSGPFYSLRCSHVLCGPCAKDSSDPHLCSICSKYTHKRDFSRAHPKSAFAADVR